MKSCACTFLRFFFAFILFSTLAFGTSKEKGLYAFQGGNDGADPDQQLIADANRNLFGVTGRGGINCGIDGYADGCGTVFELIAPSSPNGTWQKAILYTFHGSDGAVPDAPLTFDKDGNLYGTTELGGDFGSAYCGVPPQGCGVAFELSPPSEPGGSWTESVLHTFEAGADGGWPASPLLFDSAGNLYGTTQMGGADNCCGTAYELSPSSSGWTETVL